LLWRLRRATSIETGLFQTAAAAELSLNNALRDCDLIRPMRGSDCSVVKTSGTRERETAWDIPSDNRPNASALSIDVQLLLAQRFMGLEDLNGAFERISRYEVALWRQVRQIVGR
jgi:hypothetical protein